MLDFIEQCKAYRASGIFLNSQGWGDECEVITPSLLGTYSGTAILRGRTCLAGRMPSTRFLNTNSTTYINFQNITNWNIGTAGSFCGWIKLNNDGASTTAVVHARGNNPDSFTDRTWDLRVGGNSPILNCYRGSNSHQSASARTLRIGAWEFVHGKYIQGSTVQVGMNGIMDGNIAVPANFSINNPNVRALKIGSNGATSGWHTDYEVGPCAIWTGTALSDQQWATLYRSGFVLPKQFPRDAGRRSRGTLVLS